MDCSLPGSSVLGIFQARIPEWVAISSSKGSSSLRDQTGICCGCLHWKAGSLPWSHLESASSWCTCAQLYSLWLFVTPWAVAHQAPLSIGFFRQEYWTGMPFLPSDDLPSSAIESCLLHCRGILYCWSTEDGLAVDRKPQIFTTWPSPRSCWSIVTCWLAFLGE